MRIHVPLNSAVSIEMTISSVEYADGPGDRSEVGLTFECAAWDEVQLRTFRVDLVGSGIRMTGQPEQVPPIARIAIPDIEQHGYRAYPLVDHIADKVAATLQSYGTGRVASTRYKDLVDLVAIVSQATVEAEAQRLAFQSEAGPAWDRAPDNVLGTRP